jgi:hypothetical protein
VSASSTFVHRLDLLLQADLLHAQLVDAGVVRRDALIEQSGHLPFEGGTLARQPQLPQLQDTVRDDSNRGLGLPGDLPNEVGLPTI